MSSTISCSTRLGINAAPFTDSQPLTLAIPSRDLPSRSDLAKGVTGVRKTSPLRKFDPSVLRPGTGSGMRDTALWRGSNGRLRTLELNTQSPFNRTHRRGGWKWPVAIMGVAYPTEAALFSLGNHWWNGIPMIVLIIALGVGVVDPYTSPLGLTSFLQWRRHQRLIERNGAVTVTQDNLRVLATQADAIASELSRHTADDRASAIIDLAVDVARLHNRAEQLRAAHAAAVNTVDGLRSETSITDQFVRDLPDMVSLHAHELAAALSRVNQGIANRIGLIERAAELAVALRPLDELVGDSVSRVDVDEVRILAMLPVAGAVTSLLSVAAECKHDGTLTL